MNENAESSQGSDRGEPAWVTMDGIVEGRIGDITILTNAVKALNGLPIGNFELERDGGKFTILPINERRPGTGFDNAQQRQLLQHLEQIAAGSRGPIESTLRCTMVFAAETTETLFRAGPPPPAGTGVEPLTRVRPRHAADSPPPVPPPPPWRQMLKRREVILVLPLMLIAFALGAWQSGLIDRLLSANAVGLAIETGEFDDLLAIDVENDWGNYKVTVRRGAGHPDTAAAWDQRAAAAENETERLHAIVVREGQDLFVQLRDNADNVLAEQPLSLRLLVTDANGQVSTELPGHMSASRVVLSVTKNEKK